MGILYGYHLPDRGEILVRGQPTAIRSPQDALAAGIGMVHQHFMLVEPFTVLENVVLGVEGGFLLKAGLARARAELLRLGREYHLEVDLDARVGDLGVGQRQRVEILKALYRGADLLILDEPTAVLTPRRRTTSSASFARSGARARPSSSSPTSSARSARSRTW